jgi:hypothetical protein
VRLRRPAKSCLLWDYQQSLQPLRCGRNATCFNASRHGRVCLNHVALTRLADRCILRHRWRLKYWTARSWASADFRVSKVPKLRRLPVFGSLLREYSRYCPDFNFRIICALRSDSENEAPATQDGFQAGQTAKARRGPPCAVTPRNEGQGCRSSLKQIISQIVEIPPEIRESVKLPSLKSAIMEDANTLPQI